MSQTPPPTESDDLVPYQDDLAGQALEWFVLFQSGDFDQTDRTTFQQWLDQNPAHAKAYAKVERTQAAMIASIARFGLTLEEPSKPDQNNNGHNFTPAKLQTLFRACYKPALAVAASWLLVMNLIFPPQAHPFSDWLSDYHTSTGEQREVVLADGSHLLLNTNSAVSVDYDSNKRQVQLQHGQALFQVAADERRPFEVETGNVTVRALGTVFEVYLTEDGVTKVAVQEHAVTVRTMQDGNGTSPIIKAGQRISYSDNSGFGKLETVNLTETTAWQRNQLYINDKPLPEAVAEIDRYRLGRTLLVNPALAQLRVTGVFSLTDPDKNLADISQALGLKLMHFGPVLALTRQ